MHELHGVFGHCVPVTQGGVELGGKLTLVHSSWTIAYVGSGAMKRVYKTCHNTLVSSLGVHSIGSCFSTTCQRDANFITP